MRKFSLAGLFIALGFFGQLQLQAQTCTAMGQNPATAFPVCDNQSYKQTAVSLCGGRPTPNGLCTVLLDDRNPYWYKFTCYQTGTLGFTITPYSNASDYDWQMWDITNRDPNDVYNNPSWVVACNWSGESGPTGASEAGTTTRVCDGFGKPLFSAMPNIERGKTYLLLISHFSPNQAGYELVFGGGKANINYNVELDQNSGTPHGKAIINAPDFICPLDTAFLDDASTGPIATRVWNWESGFNIGSIRRPALVFSPTGSTAAYQISLVVTDTFGCSSRATKKLTVPGNCYLAVPSAFSPNGDGLNDFLYPINAYSVQQLSFSVYNRYGQLLWLTTDRNRKWNGTYKGNPQPQGVYPWTLSYYDPQKGKTINLKGTSTLLR